MSFPVTPKPISPDRGNPAITILRILLWLLPALFIPLGLLLFAFLSNFLPAGANFSITLLLAVAATAGIGLFEDLLTLQQMRKPPPYGKGTQIRWMIIFVLAQILIAPLICFGALYGYCVVTDSGYW